MEKYFSYLDQLRDSGATNMFGAVPYLQWVFPRNGGEYRCTGNMFYESKEREQQALSLGEHWASFVRVKDGWSLTAHGVIQYADSTIEWNYSTGGHFPH